MRLFGLFSLLIASVTIVCAPPAEQAAMDESLAEQAAQKEADIQAHADLSKQFDTATGESDVEMLVSIYTSDAILMDPETPALKGEDAIRSSLQELFDTVSLDSESVVEEVRLAGDWAFVRGSFRLEVTPLESGQPFEVTGNWIDVRERQDDGSWKVSRNMWNADAPLPELE
jgi:ketosteroid isomerase-like protein